MKTQDNRLPKILIPMIKKTFPELLADDIVNVQPLGGDPWKRMQNEKAAKDALGDELEGLTDL